MRSDDTAISVRRDDTAISVRRDDTAIFVENPFESDVDPYGVAVDVT